MTTTPTSATTSPPFNALGPPSTPIPFPPHQYVWGRRDDVCCVDPDTGEVDKKRNVLFRDYCREFPGDDAGACENRVTVAYWPVPNKNPIRTIMGHVEICYVLERNPPSNKMCKHDLYNKDGNATEEEDDDYDDDDEYDDEEDVVFVITRKRVAIKVSYYENMDRLRLNHVEDPLKEIAAMQLIGDSHPHVLGCTEVFFDGQSLNVVMRYCDRGDLFQLLQESRLQRSAGMPEARARYWFRQLMSGVQFLHRCAGICHRDLSPENVMIDNDYGSLIIDMGMCLRMPYLDAQGNHVDVSRGVKRCLFTPQGACGKLPYMSPEIFTNKTSWDGEAADIFSAGTILFCMVTGNRSFKQPNTSDLQFFWMTNLLAQLLDDWGVRISDEGMTLLKGMLTINPRHRFTLDEVVNHPWFNYTDDPVLPSA